MTNEEKYNRLLFNMIKNRPDYSFGYDPVESRYKVTKMKVERDWFALTAYNFKYRMYFYNKEGACFQMFSLNEIDTLIDYLRNSWIDYLLEGIE